MLLMLAFFFENLLSEENCPGQEHQMEQHLKAACHSNTMLKKTSTRDANDDSTRQKSRTRQTGQHLKKIIKIYCELKLFIKSKKAKIF